MPDLEASLEVDKFCFRKYVLVFIYKLLEVNPKPGNYLNFCNVGNFFNISDQDDEACGSLKNFEMSVALNAPILQASQTKTSQNNTFRIQCLDGISRLRPRRLTPVFLLFV